VQTLRQVRAVRRALARWRDAGDRVALVPTMGNLHAGHLALVRRARSLADRVVASVFVNPTQFGPGEDFAAYPRTLRADAAQLRAAGADLLFAPGAAGIYPRGGAQGTVVSVPGLSTDLCGAYRPGHFDGVSSVVLRLFNIVTPDVAVFGEKDYQQLVLLRRMAADLHLAVRLVGVATVREPDGLAMSSRNQYLGADERRRAPALHAALRACRERLLAGSRDYAALEREALRALRRAGFVPDYVAIRAAADLAPPGRGERRLRVLAAARLGRARLIDNVPVRLP
jgi:pantoate--beta-alanine ligase